jgi:multicomponent Na+:H+ antiporter subunit G
MTWGPTLGAIAFAGGCFFIVVAAVGILKLPDVYCRAHALGKAMTLGMMLVLIGYGLRVPESSWFKLAVILLFQLFTIPAASHLFCLIAYRKRARQWRR